jgi:hypothetical protein
MDDRGDLVRAQGAHQQVDVSTDPRTSGAMPSTRAASPVDRSSSTTTRPPSRVNAATKWAPM